jgi:transcription termination factor Rho
MDAATLSRVWLMRRMYIQMIGQPPQGAGMDPSVATEAILQRMMKTRTNIEFLDGLTEDM